MTLDEFTQVFLADGSRGAPGDIRGGQVVGVVANPAPGGRAILAEAIAVIPPAPAPLAPQAPGQ